MELQSFISDNSDYIEKLKNDGFKTKRFGRYNLLLIKYPYDKQINTDSYERYCRGAIVDLSTNRLKMIPPCKAEPLVVSDFELTDDCEVEELHDGTMINLFYHNEWLMTTRSDIGCNNRWNNQKSFREMFNECVDWTNYEHLNKDYCYSFLMKHRDNRNVSIVEDNKVLLVEVYDMKKLQKIRVDTMIPLIQTVDLHETIVNLNVENFNTFSWKGITAKRNGKRYNYINELFSHVESLNVNSNNPLYNFVDLRKQNKISDFLRFYPEYKKKFDEYENAFDKLIVSLHDSYKSVHIHRTLKRDDCDFQLRPLIYDVHGNYLRTKQNTTKLVIKKYIESLSTERLVFVLKYYL